MLYGARTKDSRMVADVLLLMILLIVMGVITEDEIPDLANLREVVREVLAK